MAVDVVMPKLTDSMEEGHLVEWQVAVGDAVKSGDVLAEVETDKAVMELESFWDGTVSEILHGKGDVVAVGQVIARIAEAHGEERSLRPAAPPEGSPGEGPAPPSEVVDRGGEAEKGGERSDESGGVRPSVEAEDEARRAREDAAPPLSGVGDEIPIPGGHARGAGPTPKPDKSPAVAAVVLASPRARKLAKERGVPLSDVEATGPGGRVTVEDVEAASQGRGQVRVRGAAEPDASVRVLARRWGVELRDLEGTGRRGRVTVDDVITARRRGRVATPPGEGQGNAEPAARGSDPSARDADEELPEVTFEKGEATVEEVSFFQRAAIRRVTASKHVIPHFYLTKSVDAEALLQRRDEERQRSGATLTHLVARACSLALERVPEANRSYDRGRWIRWNGIHLGLAVQTEAGLVVAVMRDAQGRDLEWIVERARALVQRARDGKLTLAERTNPTFTISNLGAHDVDTFCAIVNPPSALTLAVGSVLRRPVVSGGAVRAGQILNLTLSCDHRVVDGVLAARYLGEVKERLEDPGDL